jgi:hypothetical protein
MKKPAPKKRVAKPATPKLPAAKTIDEYFDRLQEPALSAIYKMREAIISSVPAEAVEFISYGVPAFKLKRVLSGMPPSPATVACFLPMR